MAIDYSEMLPPMLFGEELKKKMLCLPQYCEEYRRLQPGQRLLKLTDIYKVFVPQGMASEIYHKLYMMMSLSLKRKGTAEHINGLYADIGKPEEIDGMVSGAGSVSILGMSGVGKTTCIQKVKRLTGGEIVSEKPYNRIVPMILVTCPFDCNYKGLLGQILISLDEVLGTQYYKKAVSRLYNAQGLLSLVCNLCRVHVGILVIDEIQFIMQHKSGTMLFRMILQLINSSGIGVVLVGTQECLDYLQQAPQMARRTAGLYYSNYSYGREFRELAQVLFRYQYISERTQLTESMLSWLYEHTAGNPANLMAMIHDAQEIAILKGTEKLDIASLSEAYTKRMKMLHPYIEPGRKALPKKKKKAEITLSSETPGNVESIKKDRPLISELLKSTADEEDRDIAGLVSSVYAVEEVEI